MAYLTNEKFQISITDLQYFSQCRRKWWLEQTWEPKAPRVAFWTGSMVHTGLEYYYKNGLKASKTLAFMNAHGEKELTQIHRDLLNTPLAHLVQEYEDEFILAVGMVTNYLIREQSDPLLGTPGEVEKYFAIPIGHLPDGKVIKISGKIDLLMHRNKGGVWVVDHKTSAQKMVFTGLEVDAQLTGYAWAMWKLYDEIPRGVLYNVLLKTLPVEPTLLQPRKGQTESPGLSKAKDQKTTFEIYKAAIKAHGFLESDYVEILQYFRSVGWDRFFQREGSTRNRAELIAFEEDTLRKAHDAYLVISDPQTHAYPSAFTYNCGWCSLISVCKAMNDGGDYRAILDNKFRPQHTQKKK